MQRDNDLFVFMNSTQIEEFEEWITSKNQQVEHIKQLKDDRYGHWLFGLYEGTDKRGLIRIHNDQGEIRQRMIEALKRNYPGITISIKRLRQNER